MSERNDLKIQGVSVSLPTALFGTEKDARCLNGTCGSASNGHWAIFSGSPDLSIIRKAAEKKAKNGKIDWKESRNNILADLEQSYASDTDVKAHIRDMYYGKPYALADDVAIVAGEGDQALLVAHTPVTWVTDNTYELTRENMDEPYVALINPQYYFVFRKLGFFFLLGPGETETFTNPETGEITQTFFVPSVLLLVRKNILGEFDVRGCLMGIKDDV